MSDHAEKTPALMATKAKRRTSLQAPGDARFKTLPPAQQIFGLQSNQAVQGMVGGGNVLANGTTSNGITRTPETKWVHAGPRSSNEIVELNATIGGVYIQSARVDIADDLLRGYSRNIATRLAAIEAFSSFQRELQEEFPITSWLVTRFTSDLPESKDAPANLARANAYIRKADYRAAVDFLGAAENEVNQLVKASSGYQESQDLATDRFIAGLQGAKIAGGIAVGVLTAGSGTAAVAAVGAGYAAVHEASEQAMKVYLGLIREIDWEGIIVDAVINLAIGKLMTGLTRFSRGKEFARQFGKVAPWSFRNIPEQEIREFAVRTGKFLLSKQTVTEILIAKLTSLLQMSLKTSYDTVRGRDNGKGFVETLKVRFSAMLFDEKGDIDFQSIFFSALGDALGSATNRAAATGAHSSSTEQGSKISNPTSHKPLPGKGALLAAAVGIGLENAIPAVGGTGGGPTAFPAKLVPIVGTALAGKKVPNQKQVDKGGKQDQASAGWDVGRARAAWKKSQQESSPTTGAEQPSLKLPTTPEAAFNELRNEIGNHLPPAKPRARDVAKAMQDAEGFAKGDQPGQVNMEVHMHKDASDVRKEKNVTGWDFQSAHAGASSWLGKRIWRNGKPININYSRADAVTILLPPEVHQSFDKHWKNFAIATRQQGVTKVPVSKMLRVMQEAVTRSTIEKSQQGPLMTIIQSELRQFDLLGSDVIELPYPNVEPL